MKSARHIGTLAVCVLLLHSSTALAATLKGQLSGAQAINFKLLAVNKDSKSRTVPLAASGKFALPAKNGMTLHLIESSGRYFGPLVAVSGKKAYAVLTGKGGNLGKIKISRYKFAALTLSNTTTAFFSRKRALAFNSKTGPRGAGNFGLVKVRSSAIKAAAAEGANTQLGEDLDADALPDILDIDDDGDGKLDVVDPVQHKGAEFAPDSTSTLRLSLTAPLNANVSSLDAETIDQRIKDNLILSFWVRNNGTKEITAVNVDCSNLSYCRSPGGTATLRMENGPLPEGAPWNSYDPDGDGLPNLQLNSSMAAGASYINFRPHAGRAELRPGDTVIFKVAAGGTAFDLPGMLPFFFISSPTLKEYDNGAGIQAVNYPLAPGGAGTESNPIQLTGDSVKLTFWKPQRLPVEGAETGSFIDMGGLFYGISIGLRTGSVYSCAPSEYTSHSPTLSVRAEGKGTEVLADSAADTQADPANTLSYSLNVGACLRRQGVESSGAVALLALSASSARNDQTSQWVSVKLP